MQAQALQERVPVPRPSRNRLSVGATLLPCPFFLRDAGHTHSQIHSRIFHHDI